MAITQATTRQLGANSVNKDDIDISSSTKAVVTKIIAGTNVTISQTGADSGTGEVTINASGSGGGSGIAIGSSAITGGASGKVLYDNAGVVGELTVTGSGDAVLATSPTLAGTPLITTTPATGNSTHAIADTAFVQQELTASTVNFSSSFKGDGILTPIDLVFPMGSIVAHHMGYAMP